MLGFHVYRGERSGRVRLDRALIAATARIGGRDYAFRDLKAGRRALHYWIDEIGLDGTRRWHGLVTRSNR